MTAPTKATLRAADQPSFHEAVPPRHTVLMDDTARIRVGRRTLPIDRILLAAASILTPLGLVFIILAWYGAAHTPKLYEQMDYLISGGVLGGTLTILGGFLYFGYWLTRQLQESRRESALAMQAFRRLEDAVAGSGTGRRANGGGGNAKGNGVQSNPRRTPGTARSGPTGSGDAPTGEVPVLVATPHGSLLHRPDCPVVARRPDTHPVAPGTEGYGYCRMCDAEAVLP